MVEQRPPRVTGGNHDSFWDYCAKGELRLQGCTACGKLQWPVVKACETCGGDAFEWRPMSGRGTLVSWCSFHHDYYKGLFAMPHDVILVELEEGPLFLSNPSGFTESDCTPGMPVSCKFVACEDKSGPFNLPVFETA